jgi:hypothetical protein
MSSQIKKRWLVVLLFITPIFFMSLGWVTFYSGWAPKGRTNLGLLLNPAIDSHQLLLKPLNTAAEKSRQKTWQLITIDDGKCEEACQKRVYYMRQINVALGKNAERMQHAYLATGDIDETTQRLLTGDADLKLYHVDLSMWLKQTTKNFSAQEALDKHFIFIMDPLGNIIMYYPPEKNPHDVLDDLNKTLLRYSSVG